MLYFIKIYQIEYYQCYVTVVLYICEEARGFIESTMLKVPETESRKKWEMIEYSENNAPTKLLGIVVWWK